MKHLDLFSGIGGFALAAQWAFGESHEIVSFCEIDPFCQKILQKNFPNVPIANDIKELRGSDFGQVDIITGGFPCQPFSVAGKQRGEEDDRHLWPEMLRVIKECRPAWVIGENVAGFIPMALDQVLSDLEGEGYEARAFVIPACAVNAPHRRDRVWIVAYNAQNSMCQRSGGWSENGRQVLERQSTEVQVKRSDREVRNDPHSTHERSQRQHPEGSPSARGRSSEHDFSKNWIEVATFYGRMDDGISCWMDRCFNQIISKKDYAKAIKKDHSKDLQILQKKISSQEVWEKLGGFYTMGQKEILQSLLCRIERESHRQDYLLQEGEKIQEEELRKLWDSNEARCSPYRREYQKQLAGELANLVPQLSYEISLEIAEVWDCLWVAYSAMTNLPAELDGLKLSKSQHRAERLKSLGNAIVPQVAYEIMKHLSIMNR